MGVVVVDVCLQMTTDRLALALRSQADSRVRIDLRSGVGIWPGF